MLPARTFQIRKRPLTLSVAKPIWKDKAVLKIYELLINLLEPTGHVMYQQFNIQQLYAPPTLYLCVLYLPKNKRRIVPLTA